MSEPVAAGLAVQATRDLALSALPGALVLRDAEPVPARPLRRRAARALHRVADRLEPSPKLSPGTP